MSVAEAHDEVLRRADDEVGTWQSKLIKLTETLSHADGTSLEQLKTFLGTLRDWAVTFQRSMDRELPPDALAELRRHLFEAFAAAWEEQTPPLDRLDGLLVGLEAARHILRDAVDADVGCDPDDAQALVSFLENSLEGVRQDDIARLLGVSTRSFQRYKRAGGPANRRLRLVARLVVLLRKAWSPRGAVDWFSRPRPDLGERAPLDLLPDPVNDDLLVSAARAGRSQLG